MKRFAKLLIILLGLGTGAMEAQVSTPRTYHYPTLAGDTVSTVFDYYPPLIKNERNIIPLILISGSSYLMYGGDKSSVKMIAEYFSRLGYSVFNLNYHKGWIPLPLHDLAYKGTQSIAAGIKEIIYRSDEFHISPDKLSLFGLSAGGISSLMIATLDEDTEQLFEVHDMSNRYGSLFGNSPHIDIEIRPSTVITLGAAIADVKQIDLSDVENCNYFLIHGAKDRIVAPEKDLPFTDIGRYFNMGVDELNQVLGEVEDYNQYVKLLSSILNLEKWIGRSKLKAIDGSYLVARKIQSLDSTKVKTLFIPEEDHTILFGNERRVPSVRFKQILNSVDQFILENSNSNLNKWHRAKSNVLNRGGPQVVGGVVLVLLLFLGLKTLR